MINIKQQFKIITFVLVTTFVLFLVWGTQKVGAFIKKAAIQSETIRIAQSNTCAPATMTAETPHFSGCNSLL